MTNLPENGQTIRFSKVPAGSYCTAGVAYRVERHKGGDFRFVNVEKGSSTYDRPWAVLRAKWEVIA